MKTQLTADVLRNPDQLCTAEHSPQALLPKSMAPKELVKLLENAGHIVIPIGCTGEGQVSDRLQKNFGQRLKCGEHRCRLT